MFPFNNFSLHRQHNRYIGVATYTNSLILIYYIGLKCFSRTEYHPPFDWSKSTDTINKSGNFYSYQVVLKVKTAQV